MADTVRQYGRLIALSLPSQIVDSKIIDTGTLPRGHLILYCTICIVTWADESPMKERHKLPLMTLFNICLVALQFHTKELKKFIGSDKYVKMMGQVENFKPFHLKISKCNQTLQFLRKYTMRMFNTCVINACSNNHVCFFVHHIIDYNWIASAVLSAIV